jgi:hypothetical protein
VVIIKFIVQKLMIRGRISLKITLQMQWLYSSVDTIEDPSSQRRNGLVVLKGSLEKCILRNWYRQESELHSSVGGSAR